MNLEPPEGECVDGPGNPDPGDSKPSDTDLGGAHPTRPYEQLPPPDEGSVYVTEVFDEQRYMSTGTFPDLGGRPRCAPTRKPGEPCTCGGCRKMENLTRVGCLVLDMDVKDWLVAKAGMSRDEASATVHAATPEELAEWVEALGVAFAAAWVLTVPRGWIPTAAVCSGAGIHVYLWLPDDQGRTKEDIANARLANKDLVRRLNANAGFALADRAAVDAGTRILRPLHTFHTKNRERPLEVLLLDAVRDDDPQARFDLRHVVGLWKLGVETRIPTIKQKSLKDRLDVGEGGPGADLLGRLFGSRVAALREIRQR